MIETLQKIILKSHFLAAFFVFWAGYLASLSSCTFIRIPIVFGYVSGAPGSKKRSMILSLCLASGLIVSYTFFGISLILLKNLAFGILRISRYIYLALGGILLGGGLFYAGLIPAKGIHAPCAIDNKFKKSGLLNAFIFGIMFAFLEIPSCPCCASLIFVIAGIAGLSNSWVYSFIIFFSFAIGQSLPLLLIGSSAGLMKALTSKAERAEKHIQFAAGTMLIVAALIFFIIS